MNIHTLPEESQKRFHLVSYPEACSDMEDWRSPSYNDITIEKERAHYSEQATKEALTLEKRRPHRGARAPSSSGGTGGAAEGNQAPMNEGQKE